jgi:AbrB family looped-hinge helix DNA binding protein
VRDDRLRHTEPQSIEEAMATVTISPKFQVVIPKDVRERMKLRPGQKVAVFEFENRIEFVPVRSMKSMRGYLAGMDTGVERDPDRV